MVLGHDSPPDASKPFVFDRQSVGDALEPVFMAESEFQVASKRQNLLQRRHWFWTSTWTAP